MLNATKTNPSKPAAKAPAKPAKIDPLDAVLAAGPERVIALMLWKARHRQPDLFVQIDPEDIRGLDECTTYLKVKTEVRIHRPEGVAAQEAIPATHGRRAIPGREAIPPKPYVVVTLVEAGTKNVIRPVENNQDDFDASQEAAAVRKARDQAPDLARRLIEQGNTGDTSLSDMHDAANALLILARAQAA